ncbi:poly(rC)-binding protein 4 isoform X2 [Arachis ipaensis]|uniref:poly(rC)-binding protein 4 isoform X2 n=1 Tax=Arachis ipaensis TaxID=130454 RepID=UPI000A2B430D|nr:poly(rC)-binding protein 4 isoform X2 [Arachis ipaensis]XP_025649676.1 poly(rC)-binding protein 4 isoform X2 [Arachis hypogaea]
MSQQQGQIPINPMVPQQNPMAPSIPMHMNMHMHIPNMNINMPMPMSMPLPMQMQMHHIPLPHHQLPLQVSYDSSIAGTPSSGGKRRREDEAPGTAADADLFAAKRAKGQDVIFRIVVPSRQIGKVIGKEGCRIQKIREATRATIKIADAIAEDDSNLEALKVAVGHVAANTIRLLIAGSQAGGLIGVSGQNIEKLRNSSGATITVLAPNQLPLCASALESDRVVQLSGDVPAVMKALEEIGCQLRENPPRQVISISPTYNYAAIRPSQTYLDPTSVDYVTFEMLISETMVGGLIGRCGSNISRIRSESGAMIKVYGGKGEQKHRHIQFGGSAEQVALAKQRVDEYIYSQLIQQAGAQQSTCQR